MDKKNLSWEELNEISANEDRAMTPSSGYNIVGSDRYADVFSGEPSLYLIQHCATLDEAKAARAQAASKTNNVVFILPRI